MLLGSSSLVSQCGENTPLFSGEIKNIELLNNKLHGLSPPGGLMSPPGEFASLLFDQGVP